MVRLVRTVRGVHEVLVRKVRWCARCPCAGCDEAGSGCGVRGLSEPSSARVVNMAKRNVTDEVGDLGDIPVPVHA
jgi:hypothetical protein